MIGNLYVVTRTFYNTRLYLKQNLQSLWHIPNALYNDLQTNLVCGFVYNWLMACLFRNHGTTPEVWCWKLLPAERLSMETKFHQTQWFKEPQKISFGISFIWFTFALSKAKQEFRKSPVCIAGIPGSSRWCDLEVGLVLQQGIAEVPCSSTVQRVPITQPHSTATQIPAATRVKGHQVAVQGWSKEPKGSWGTRSTLTFLSEAERHQSTALAELLQKGNWVAARPKCCCFTWS